MNARALPILLLSLIVGYAAAVGMESDRGSAPDDSVVAADSVYVPVAADTTTIAADTSAGGTSATGGRNIFLLLGDDLVAQATSPFRIDGGDLVWLGAGAAALGGLLYADEAIDRDARSLVGRNLWIDRTGDVVTELGGNYGFAGAALFAGYSYLFGSDRDRETTIMLGEALVTTTVWVRLGKMAAGRERPSVAAGHPHPHGGKWSGPIVPFTNPDNLSRASFESFPSGHTSTAFAIATVFAKRYDETLVVPAIAYTAATLVGASRVIEGQHWASDVFVGACLGYLCASQVVSRGEVRRAAADSHGEIPRLDYRFYADFSSGGAGLGLMMTF